MSELKYNFLGLDLFYNMCNTNLNLMYGKLVFDTYTIRTFGTLEEPWFCGKDVCVAMGMVNHTRVLQKLNEQNGVKRRLIELLPSNDIKKIVMDKLNITVLVFFVKQKIL